MYFIQFKYILIYVLSWMQLEEPGHILLFLLPVSCFPAFLLSCFFYFIRHSERLQLNFSGIAKPGRFLYNDEWRTDTKSDFAGRLNIVYVHFQRMLTLEMHSE